MFETPLQLVDLLTKDAGAALFGPAKKAGEHHGRLPGGDAAPAKPGFECGIGVPKRGLNPIRPLAATHRGGTPLPARACAVGADDLAR